MYVLSDLLGKVIINSLAYRFTIALFVGICTIECAFCIICVFCTCSPQYVPIACFRPLEFMIRLNETRKDDIS